MINVNVSKKDGLTIGAWVFDSDSQKGVFLTMPAVTEISNIMSNLDDIKTGFEDTFDNIICSFSNTKQIILADGIREEEGNVSRSIEFVIIEPSEQAQFAMDLERVQ